MIKITLSQKYKQKKTLFENFKELIKIKKTSLYIFTRNISLFFCIVGNFLDVVINACWVLIQPLCVFKLCNKLCQSCRLRAHTYKDFHSRVMYLKQSTSSGCAFPQRCKVIRHINPEDKLSFVYFQGYPRDGRKYPLPPPSGRYSWNQAFVKLSQIISLLYTSMLFVERFLSQVVVFNKTTVLCVFLLTVCIFLLI